MADQPATTSESGSSQGRNDAVEMVKKLVAFDEYPWQFDKDFLRGVLHMTTGLDRDQALDSCLQARIWWYESKQNIQIPVQVYKIFDQSRRGPTKRPDGGILAKLKAIREKMAESELKKLEESGNDVPGWQKYASKANLHLKADEPGADIARDVSATGSTAGSTVGGDGSAETGAIGGDSAASPSSRRVSNAGGGSAPYPEQFQAIIEAVTTGKPIAGVKEIPDTVLRPSGVSPVGTMQAPLKPWQRKAAAASTSANESTDSSTSPFEMSSLLTGILDQNFPPLEASDDASAVSDKQKEENAMMREG